MVDSERRCASCGALGAECVCDPGAQESARFRLVPTASDPSEAATPAVPLIREYKGPTVAELDESAGSIDFLPTRAHEGSILVGPGFGRRRAWIILWPLFVLMAVVVAGSTWIALS